MKKTIPDRLELPVVPPMFEREGRSILTGLEKGIELPRYAILAVRDPQHFDDDIADVIAQSLFDVHEVSRKSMLTLLRGKMGDAEVLVCSTGSGSADTEIAMMDLAHYAGVDTFIRIGFCGALQPEITPGDLIIASGAVRDDGMTKDYVDVAYPAFASYELILPLIEAAQRKSIDFHVGIIRSNDSIYCGQGRPVCGYIQTAQQYLINYWTRAGIMGIDRETSSILTLSSLMGMRGGSVCATSNNSATGKFGGTDGIMRAMQVALEAIELLHTHDTQKEKNNKAYWTPWCAK